MIELIISDFLTFLKRKNKQKTFDTYFLKFSLNSSYVTNPSSAAAILIAFSTSTPLIFFLIINTSFFHSIFFISYGPLYYSGHGTLWDLLEMFLTRI